MGPFLEAGQDGDNVCQPSQAVRPLLMNEDGGVKLDGSGIPDEAQKVQGIRMPHTPIEKESKNMRITCICHFGIGANIVYLEGPSRMHTGNIKKKKDKSQRFRGIIGGWGE